MAVVHGRRPEHLVNPEVWDRLASGPYAGVTSDDDDPDRCGRIWWMGQAHSRAYRDIPVYFPETGIQPRLVAVADNVPERLDLARDNFGFAAGHLDWRELIARDDIDVVDITAPNALHREIVEAAAAAGKHLGEKPVGIDPDATAAIELAGRRASVIAGCGYNYRWAPLVQYTRQLIAEVDSAS